MADEAIASHYQVLEELGRGSFGVVYKGIEKSTGEIVAIKHIDLESTEDDIQDIQAEISVLSTCASSHVTQYKASFLRGSKLWIVMEYLGGGSCLDLLKPEPCVFPEPHIAIICRELLAGLEYLHAEGKIHRDIKSANILLSETGKVKLADFGVAAQLTNIKSQRNTFVGTPFWMAPEVIQQDGYDFRADIWSLGITALELAYGEPPHANLHPMKALFHIPKVAPPKLEGNFSRDFKDFVAQCLIKEGDRRPTAKELSKHRFIKHAGKVELLQELIERRRRYDASKTRRQSRSLYQETLHTMSPKDDQDDWVFDTVRPVAPRPRVVSAKSHPQPSSMLATEEGLRRMDLKDAPLQPSSPAQPSTMRASRTIRRQRTINSMAQSLATMNSGPGPPGSAVRKPLQADLSFGNSGSSQRLFRRVPSDSTNHREEVVARPSSTEALTDENKLPRAVEATTKEAILGRRLYSKAVEPTLDELHAQTSTRAKRDALAKLSDAFAALDNVDPEGAFQMMQTLVSTMSQDTKLSTAFLPPKVVPIKVDGAASQATVVKSVPAAPNQSPTKLVLAPGNPHLKSHKRRQGSNAGEASNPLDDEKAALAARFPGREPVPGMEHCKQLSDVLYGRWLDGLQSRWPNL